MTLPRDPRVDPMPGDVVRVVPESGAEYAYFRQVTARDGYVVEWVVGRLGYSGWISHWKRINAAGTDVAFVGSGGTD